MMYVVQAIGIGQSACLGGQPQSNAELASGKAALAAD